MRGFVAALAVLAVLTLARAAGATGICDPAGHFCVQLDATSARVCELLRPGGLDPADCDAADAEAQAGARQMARSSGADSRVVDSAVLHFDGWQTIVAVLRLPERAEATSPADAAPFWDRLGARVRPAGWLLEQLQPPTLARIHDVQVIRTEARMSSSGIGGVVTAHLVGFEVRARDASYVLLFQSGEPDAGRLASFADQTLATLDALPRRNPTASGEGLVWLLRGGAIAGLVVGIAWWLGRRKGRRGGIDARDLWPR